jgi:hypothetical protein
MSISYRRYEVLLPRRHNDGRRVPARFVTETMVELRERFGAASCETQTIRGQWQHQGSVCHDELVRVFADVEDTPENRQFFLSFKTRLKSRFDQIEIWLTSHPIDVL